MSIQLDQGTPEWFKQRRSIITTSPISYAASHGYDTYHMSTDDKLNIYGALAMGYASGKLVMKKKLTIGNFRHNSVINKDKVECPICTDTPHVVFKTECNHIFCPDCIHTWSGGEHSVKCPLCMSSIKLLVDE